MPGIKSRSVGVYASALPWCGAVLCDYDLNGIAVLEGDDPTPGMWETGALVMVDGNASWVVDHEDGAELPPEACTQLDHEVTA